MTALASNVWIDRSDIRSWLCAMAGRGGFFSMAASDTGAGAEVIDRAAAGVDLHDVRATLGGDEQAFERIVRRHQLEVSRRLRRFSRDPRVHEELVQETFVQAFLGLRSYRGDAPLIHWLHRIAVRVGYRSWRVRRSMPAHVALDGDVIEAVAAPVAREGDELQGVLDRLPPRDRLVVTLLYVEGRGVRETAALTGWSQTMVKVQAFRARRRLRKLMQDRGEGGRDHERG